MGKQAGKPQTQRQLKVGEELRHALAWIIERGELRDPVLTGRAITITEVRVSPDLRNATAFIMPLGGGDAEDIAAALRRAKSFLRRLIAQSVKLRHVPDLSFQPDVSFDTYSHIDNILHKPEVARDLGPREDDAEEEGDA